MGCRLHWIVCLLSATGLHAEQPIASAPMPRPNPSMESHPTPDVPVSGESRTSESPSLLAPDHREDAVLLLDVLSAFEATANVSQHLRNVIDRGTSSATPGPGAGDGADDSAPDSAIAVTAGTRENTTGRLDDSLTDDLFQHWHAVIQGWAEPSNASAYLPQIQTIFSSERVPVELAWLAEVESAFDPEAKSPVGAVGLFQLMPGTAVSLGLSTWLPDERRNVSKNSQAAARYLRSLHQRFGDWRLALAAYNAGPTRVGRLLSKSGEQSYAGIAPLLPSETRNYVAKVEATLWVRENIQLSSLENDRL